MTTAVIYLTCGAVAAVGLAYVVRRHLRLSRSPKAPTRPSGGTITSQHVQVTVARAGLTILRKRTTPVGDVWEDHLDLQWSSVNDIELATDRHDPVVALYVQTTAGKRHHAMDERHLSRSQWAEVAQLIAEATGQRVTLDLSGRHGPRIPDA